MEIKQIAVSETDIYGLGTDGCLYRLETVGYPAYRGNRLRFDQIVPSGDVPYFRTGRSIGWVKFPDVMSVESWHPEDPANPENLKQT